MLIQDVKIAVVGLGYVGLPLAVEFAKKRAVLGFDINPARILALQQGHDHTLEVDDAELASAKGLRCTGERADLRAAAPAVCTLRN